MDQTLYGDVLFLVNFSMDFLTLFVTGRILHRRIRPGRLTLASAIGGLYGVAACFMSGWLLWQIVVNVAVSFLMCYVAFDRRVLPCCALFYGCGCLLGGVMTVLYGVLERSEISHPAVGGTAPALPSGIPLGWMAVVAGLAGAAAVAGGRWSRRTRAAPECEIAVTQNGAIYRFRGFCDGGDLLTDPIGGRPVILLEPKAMRAMLPEPLRPAFANGDPGELATLPPEYARRIRLIPSRSVGGNRLLVGFLPDGITVSGVEKAAVLAPSPAALPAGFDALVPGCLAEGAPLNSQRKVVPK